MKSVGKATVQVHPSLALIKYWGKADPARNLPATPSLGVSLDGLTTTTQVHLQEGSREADSITVGGLEQPTERYAGFFKQFRKLAAKKTPGRPSFRIEGLSQSDFPMSAGLASSASGFAALAWACCAAAGISASPSELSALARWGSASAARSIWGGFVRLDARRESAWQVHNENWWPSLRIVVVEVEYGPKPISSRQAMELTRKTSPFYAPWMADASKLMDSALQALENQDLETLGPLIRKSYLRMFATMFAADPPVIYWKPKSLQIIQLCEELRNRKVGVWETMDAGPQVKLVCLEENLAAIEKALDETVPHCPRRVCRVGGGPEVLYK